MAYTITPANVRGKLISVSSVKLSDTVLATAGHIPAAIAYINKLLDLNSKDYDEEDADEKALIDAAGIIMACVFAIQSYPTGDFTEGPTAYKGIKAAEKDGVEKGLMKQYMMIMNLLNYRTMRVPTASFVGGNNVVPDAEDRRNISLHDTTNVFSYGD